MDWTYAKVENSSDIVSEQLDIYGYSIYFSPIAAFFPGKFQTFENLLTIFEVIENLFVIQSSSIG